ncbi:MAG TPA: NAD(P)-dependent oxidoreductase [Terriglobia bacterium]|nr:NAD(P)-dependent oxidoreductase [Terriglobia bacterium]
MKVLVTGASGFIGSQVTRQIVHEGHETWALTLPGESTTRLKDILDRLTVVPLDLCETKQVRELVRQVCPDCTIHLAWYAVPGKYWNAPENLDCVSMTLALARALAEVKCSRLVAAGSCAEYDWDYGFLSEGVTPLKPRGLYGTCKNATRQALQSFCKEAAMEFAWTRFFFLYGPGEPKDRLVSSVVTSLLSGQEARCTEGGQIRDFLHVRDLGAAVWAVARSSLSGPVNIGSGIPVSVREIVEIIAKLIGGPGKLQLGAVQDSSEQTPMILADVRKLKRETGWTPSFDLEEGLRDTIAYWRGLQTDSL